MSWHKYTLAFRLCTPMHIGWRKTGNLMQTRGYVPGKNVWAALTERLTRRTSKGADTQSYVQSGETLHENFRFGYLYPALPQNADKAVASAEELTAHYPWNDKLFAYRFFGSYASTALNYEQQSAEDALLHETEFVRPYSRPGPGATTALPVYLKGDLFVKQELSNGAVLGDWQAALTQLCFGAERGYGWGRVQPLPLAPPTHVDDPMITLSTAEFVSAHVRADPRPPLAGAVEPLTGWERATQNGHHWQLAKVQICYAPGSTMTGAGTFRIGPYGIWEVV
ncbi:MAG: hypothetical protein DYG89_23565 [Caldilinea sp. CFX5]|nr:hypothetical protein [Caldilinea sp. CFX5]